MEKIHCYLCGRPFIRSQLQLHHFSYKPSKTKLVCRRCHILWHFKFGFPLEQGEKWIDFFKIYIRGSHKVQKELFGWYKKNLPPNIHKFNFTKGGREKFLTHNFFENGRRRLF